MPAWNFGEGRPTVAVSRKTLVIEVPEDWNEEQVDEALHRIEFNLMETLRHSSIMFGGEVKFTVEGDTNEAGRKRNRRRRL